MVTILILAVVAAAGILAARLMARAIEAEHLVVLRHARGWTLFERDGDRRYHPVPMAGVPAALCRFACGVRAVVRVRSGG